MHSHIYYFWYFSDNINIYWRMWSGVAVTAQIYFFLLQPNVSLVKFLFSSFIVWNTLWLNLRALENWHILLFILYTVKNSLFPHHEIAMLIKNPASANQWKCVKVKYLMQLQHWTIDSIKMLKLCRCDRRFCVNWCLDFVSWEKNYETYLHQTKHW